MRVTVPEFDGPILRSQARRGNRGEEGASDVPEGTGSGSAGIRDETRNLGWALCGQAGVLVDQAAQPGTADDRPSAHDLVCWHRHIEIRPL